MTQNNGAQTCGVTLLRYILSGVMMSLAEERMADLFKCDKCKQIFEPSEKRGRILLEAIGYDTLPHANFRGELWICRGCFSEYQEGFMRINPQLQEKIGPRR
jgi:hypothetical protein